MDRKCWSDRDRIGRHATLVLVAGLVSCLFLAGCKKPEKSVAGSQPNESTEASELKTEGEAQADESQSIRNWATEGFNSAISSGGQTVDDTNRWLTDLYKSARDQGATSATSMKEWVSDDWHAQGDWEYKILNLKSADQAAVESALNEAGSSRWDCYHVDTTGEVWTFFMKRTRRSYLSKIPLRDLTRILPGLGGEGE